MEITNDLIGKEAVSKIREIINNSSTGMLVSQLEMDNPSVCPMTAKAISDDGYIWFLSTKASEHYQNIQDNPKVLLTFSNADDDQYLSVSGKGAHSTEESDINAIWEEDDAKWYENGREDENVVALKVSISDAYYWDSFEQKSVSL